MSALVVVVAAVLLLRGAAAAGAPIGDCCCGTGVVDAALEERLGRTLDALRDTRYLSVFRVDLEDECAFWQDDATCARKACSVCECEEDDIPAPWRVEPSAPVDRTAAEGARRDLDEEDDEGGGTEAWVVRERPGRETFVDMRRNAESYTGYEGDAPHRIWSAIYNENCFEGADDECVERRIFFRLVSGLHAAISCHIAWNFPAGRTRRVASDPRGPQYCYDPMDDDGEQQQAPSHEVFDFKVGRHPDRVENLYFALVFVMRAARKASPALLARVEAADEAAEGGEEVALVRDLVRDLVRHPAVVGCEPGSSFNEAGMFGGGDNAVMLHEFKAKFRNISRILSCVGCERCKLHGKLQVLGIGTALKVLLAPGDRVVSLQRTEAVALVHTLGKLVHAARVVRWMGEGGGGGGGGARGWGWNSAAAVAVAAAVVLFTAATASARRRPTPSTSRR